MLEDNEARDLSNVQGTTAGAIVKRGGLVTLGQPPSILTSLFPFETNTSVLVGAGDTSLYSVNAGGAATQIATGLMNGARWEFCSAPIVSGQGPLYGVNGVDTPRQWSGSGSAANWTNATGGVNVPNGKYCIYAQNQVFIRGVGASPSRVYWSAIADPTNWDPASLTGAGFVDLDPNDGQHITAIGQVGPYVLVAKPRKLWVIVDTATATVRRLSNNVGCVAHRSLATGPEGTFFLAEDRGVYTTNGSKLTPISDVIQPTIDSMQSALRAQASGVVFDAHYYLSVPISSSNNDTTLDFDLKLNSWWKHSFGSNQFAIWHVSGQANLYSAKATAAFVDQAFVDGIHVDNGQNFTWVWRGPWQSPTFYRRRRFPTPYFRKRLRQFRCDGSGHVDFSMAKDFALNETLIKPDIFSSQGASAGSLFGGNDGSLYGANDGSLFGDTTSSISPIRRGRVYAGLGVANAFGIVFSGTNPDPATVYSYVLMITDRRDLVVA